MPKPDVHLRFVIYIDKWLSRITLNALHLQKRTFGTNWYSGLSFNSFMSARSGSLIGFLRNCSAMSAGEWTRFRLRTAEVLSVSSSSVALNLLWRRKQKQEYRQYRKPGSRFVAIPSLISSSINWISSAYSIRPLGWLNWIKKIHESRRKFPSRRCLWRRP